MIASLVYIAEAETDMRVIRERSFANLPGMLAVDLARQNHERLCEKAAKNLSVARFKLDSARTRLNAIIEGEGHRVSEVANETRPPIPQLESRNGGIRRVHGEQH